MGHRKWSEIKRAKGAPDGPIYAITVEPDGERWLVRVVGRPELVTQVESPDEAQAMAIDLITTSNDVPRERIRIVTVD